MIKASQFRFRTGGTGTTIWISDRKLRNLYLKLKLLCVRIWHNSDFGHLDFGHSLYSASMHKSPKFIV